MNSAKRVNEMVAEWKASGKTKTEIIINTANAEIGWCYVWGATGQECTPSKRQACIARISEAEAAVAKKKCQVLRESNPKSTCDGCKYFPNGETTLMDDCQGFVKQVCKRVGITFKGGGCSSMWKDNSNWSDKGTIDTLPERLCCVFWQDPNNKTVMSHIGFYVGNKTMIHCSGEVKKETLSKKCTHWAIPAGLNGDEPMPVEKPTLRRGSRGEWVSFLQTELVNRGYSVGASGVDGIFGAATETAVKNFQRNSGIKVDGIVGNDTWNALSNTDPIQLYTVHIPGLPLYKADALVASYDGATMTKD